MSVKNSTLILQVEDLLMGSEIEKHPLIEKEQLKFLAWEISGKIYLQEY